MKAIIASLIVIGVLYGAWYYMAGEDPVDSYVNTDAVQQIETAREVTDLYGSATDKRLEAEFGQ